MRTFLKLSVWCLLMAAGAAALPEVQAQLFTIFPRTNVWRYETNCQFNNGWELETFDDSTWGFGPGGFTGGETAGALRAQCSTTNLPAPNAGGAGGRPNYFRTHFNIGSTNGLSLVLSNAIDDGAKFYLNGVQVLSLRGPNTNDCPAFSTAGAPGAGTDAVLWEVSTLTPALLGGIIRPGDNVFAVSVHQLNAGSSDLVFAEVMMGQFDVAPTIDYAASSLSNRTVLQCRATTLSVSASGLPAPTYQWHFNAFPIPGATNATLTITNFQDLDTGNYFVTVSNGAGSTNSSPDTVLSYQPDMTPPSVLLAYAAIQDSPNRLTVIFDEPVDPGTATNPFNYFLNDTNTGFPLMILGVTNPNSTTVILDVSPALDPAHGHALLLANIADACAGNVMTLPVFFPVSTYVHPAIALDATTLWKYDQSGVNLSNAWTAPAYNDGGWLSGAGTFDAKRTNAASPLPLCRPVLPNGAIIRSCLTLSNAASTAQIPTIYFRKQFSFSGNPTGAVLRARSLLDDGAVFHLNGVECGRIGMPTGAVAYTTLANRAPGDAAFETNYFAFTALKEGVNVIAVELHQQALTSSDSTFGLELEVMAASPLAPEPHVIQPPSSQTVQPGGTVTLAALVSGDLPVSYQWHVNCRDIRNATSATLTISNMTPADVGNYSVTVSNALGKVTSDDAALGLGSYPVPPVKMAGFRGDTNLALQWLQQGGNPQLEESATLSPPAWSPSLLSSVLEGNLYTAIVPFALPPRLYRVATTGPALGLTQPPAGRAAALGEEFFMSVTATGLPPFAYQWTLNAVELPGQTNAALLVAISNQASYGAYQVSVRESTGNNVLSRAAVVRPAGLETVLADQFENRRLLTNASGSVHGTTFAASLEPGETNHTGMPGGRSVWLSWQAPDVGVVYFDTLGSGFDTLLDASTGNNLLSLVSVASDDDSGPNQCSAIGFNVIPGEIYNISLDGLAGAAGFYVVNWSFQPTTATLPIIDLQPEDRVLGTNQTSTTFFVSAQGPGLSYQWFYYDTPIGATNGGNNATLTLGGPGPAAPFDVGEYSVVVSNPSFAVRSRVASLQLSSEAPALRARTKTFGDFLCGGPSDPATNCCGGSFAASGKNGPKFLASQAGSVSTGSGLSSGSYGGTYKWVYVKLGFTCEQRVCLIASVQNKTTQIHQANTIMVVYPINGITHLNPPGISSGTSTRTMTHNFLANQEYEVAIGHKSTVSATKVSLIYIPDTTCP